MEHSKDPFVLQLVKLMDSKLKPSHLPHNLQHQPNRDLPSLLPLSPLKFNLLKQLPNKLLKPNSIPSLLTPTVNVKSFAPSLFFLF